MEIPEDIRAKLGEIDHLAGQILEYLYDESESLAEIKESAIFDDLDNTLEELQSHITEIQEQQGWI